jgi:hypothetical protein
MFDEIVTRCPKCDTVVVFQSKAGPCKLVQFDADKGVPPNIAADIQYDSEWCGNCNVEIELIPTIPITQIPLRAVVKR